MDWAGRRTLVRVQSIIEPSGRFGGWIEGGGTGNDIPLEGWQNKRDPSSAIWPREMDVEMGFAKLYKL